MKPRIFLVAIAMPLCPLAVSAQQLATPVAQADSSAESFPAWACPWAPDFAAIPGIAGRSPSYLVRQLYDFQQGNRAGDAGEMMQPVVAKLSSDDMIALGAYLASLQP